MVKRRKIVLKKRISAVSDSTESGILSVPSTEVLVERERTKQVLIRYIAYLLIAVLSALISLFARQVDPVPQTLLEDGIENLHLFSTPGAVLADVLQSLLGRRPPMHADPAQE